LQLDAGFAGTSSRFGGIALLNGLIVDLAPLPDGTGEYDRARLRFLTSAAAGRASNVSTLVQGGLAIGPTAQASWNCARDRRQRHDLSPKILCPTQWPAVLDLLLTDDTNPGPCLPGKRTREHAARLPRPSEVAAMGCHRWTYCANCRRGQHDRTGQALLEGREGGLNALLDELR